MALIELNFGREPTDDTDDTDGTRVETPDDGGDAGATSNARRLLGASVVLGVAAGAGYLLYRREAAREESEFAEITFDDETAAVGTESADE